MRAVAALANGAWLAASIPAWRRFRKGLRDPEETQWHVLRRQLDENAACAYGKAHGFGEIRRYEQFRERVPIVDYDALESWVTRIMRGEEAVLTREPVTRLLPTSGSTSARKLIPFTAGLQGEFNRAIGPWIVDLARAHPAMVAGSSYWSVSPAIPASTTETSVVPVGFDDDSAYLGGIRRRLVEGTFAVPSALRLVHGMDDFRYLTLLCLLRRPDWSFASVWHPSFLTLLFDALPAAWDELLEDVAKGGCRRAAGRPEVLRAVQAPPDPRRARWLSQRRPDDPPSIWPRLRLISCWGDGQAALALARLQTCLPQAAIQSKGLLATEAFVSIPFQASHPLAVTSHFFEFSDEIGRVRRLHELQRGQRYTVIVTTAGGLWRYRLGDLVEVDGFVESTPSIRFVGRVAGISDLRGEKLAESFVTQAVHDACAAFGFSPPFAMLAPEIEDGHLPHYVLFVEGLPPAGLGARLDQELRRNPHYTLCRDLGQLGPPDCVQTPPCAYQIFARFYLSEKRLGDIKPQSLSSRTGWKSRFV